DGLCVVAVRSENPTSSCATRQSYVEQQLTLVVEDKRCESSKMIEPAARSRVAVERDRSRFVAVIEENTEIAGAVLQWSAHHGDLTAGVHNGIGEVAEQPTTRRALIGHKDGLHFLSIGAEHSEVRGTAGQDRLEGNLPALVDHETVEGIEQHS